MGFLLLFLILLVRSSHPVGSGAGTPLIRAAEPVELFFRIDPLAALLSLVASHHFYNAMLPSLGVVLLTVLLGRVFCGWVCPLGTLNQLISWIFRPSRKVARRKRNEPRPWHGLKYAVLAACLGSAVLGSAAGGWLDPLAILTRGLGMFALPALDLLAPETLGPTREGLGGSLEAIRAAVTSGASFLSSFRPQRFQGGWLVGLLLLAVLAANAFHPRFWCRTLCPLGALLALLSRVSLLGMRKRPDRCIACGACETHCQGADRPRGGQVWRESECVACLNCAASCPAAVIAFRFLPPREQPAPEGAPAVSRRHLVGAAAAGAALVPLCRVGPGLGVADDPRLIRPPGALAEREFLARCIRCGQCMKSCPTNAIHPAMGEGGVEGLLGPVLIMRIGYCEPSCVTCSQVCPTGALRPLTEDEKQGRGRHAAPLRIGTAFIDRGRCLPWAMSTPCIVCEEFCPAHPKAIWVERVEVGTSEEGRISLFRPSVDPARCVGCGACEYICPVRTPPAITISSVGESRSPDNRILLLPRTERTS